MFNELKSRIVSSPPAPRGLPALPSGWRYERLRSVAELRVSGVDKLTLDDESPVRLCNYTDVYKNDYIVDKPGYMSATASRAEIARFRLEQDDVVITKDSETWNDIAVPAYVVDAAHDFVCAYHLAIVRPRRSLLRGSYLHHALREPRIANQFHVAASGVTRFGLTQDAIKSVQVPVPPMDEQAAIVKYLGHAHARIDRAVAAKRKLVALLEEQKQAIIHQAVTRGLDPNVPLKDSGISWLGEIPAHWRVSRIAREFDLLDYRRVPLASEIRGRMTAQTYDYYGASGVIDKVEDYLFDEATILIAEDGANLVLRNLPLAIKADGKYWVNNHAHILRPRNGDIDFLVAMLEGLDYRPWISGAAQPKLTQERLRSIALAVPPRDEQQRITDTVRERIYSETRTIGITRREIDLLGEFRTRLTSDVVTGQVDVREIAATLPELKDAPTCDADNEFGDDRELVESELEFAGVDE